MERLKQNLRMNIVIVIDKNTMQESVVLQFLEDGVLLLDQTGEFQYGTYVFFIQNYKTDHVQMMELFRGNRL